MSLIEFLGLGVSQLPQQGFGFQLMDAQRMAYGHEPIDWKQILLNQLRAEAYGRSLNEFEQFLFDSLVKGVEQPSERTREVKIDSQQRSEHVLSANRFSAGPVDNDRATDIVIAEQIHKNEVTE